MCDFCSKPKPKKDTRIDPPEHQNNSISDEISAIIKGSKLVLDYDAYSCDSSFYEEIDILFCPMCGKALKPE